MNLEGNVTLSGGGAVILKTKSGNVFLRGSGGVTLTNTDNTIQGSGVVADSGMLNITNNSTINANASGDNLDHRRRRRRGHQHRAARGDRRRLVLSLQPPTSPIPAAP